MAAPAPPASGAGDGSSGSNAASDLTSSDDSASVPTISRIQPHGFHQGPDEQTEADADANAAADGGASSTVGPVAPSSRLCRDVLVHIFGFLDKTDFSLSVRTHKAWQAIAIGMKSRRDELIVTHLAHFDSLLISPLRHHVTSVQLGKHAFVATTSLASELSHLTALTLPIEVHVGMEPPRLPPNLQSLVLHIEFPNELTSPERVAIYDTLGQSIVRLRRLHTCDFMVSNGPPLPATLLLELASLPALTALTSCCGLAIDGIDAIRRMAHLRTLRAVFWTVEHLRRLVAGDAAPIPPLESFLDLYGFDFGINAETTPLLLRLPTLTRLNGKCDLPDIRPLLRGLPNLRGLELKCTETVNRQHLVDAVKACPQLTSISLVHPLLTTACLSTILSSLPCLVTFDSELHPGLTTLSFLASAGPSLTNVFLQGQQCVDLREMHHLDAMPLVALGLTEVFSERFDSYSLETRTPESPFFNRRAWPHLAYFDYSFGPESEDH